MRTLPEIEIIDITKSCIDKIWIHKGTRNQNWENRIFGTYTKLAKRNPIFSKHVDKSDFWRCVNEKYDLEYSNSEFKEKIMEEMCTFNNFEFYFTIPAMYNFPTGLRLGLCICYKFPDLPKNIQKEFVEWWKIAYPWKKEEIEEKEHRLEILQEFLFLKIRVKSIGFENALNKAQESVETNLNILRFVFRTRVYFTGITLLWGKKKILDGIWGNWEDLTIHFSNARSYDKMYDDDITILSQIFSEMLPVDLEQRIKEAVICYGLSHSLPYDPLKLIMLCSGLEALVVKEWGAKGEIIAKRIPDLISKNDTTLLEGNLRQFYRKRSSVVHATIKEKITKSDVYICQDYLHNSIQNMITLRKHGYATLFGKPMSKSIANKFNWKIQSSKD